MLLHTADISNPAKPRAAYLNWTDRVLAEFYAVRHPNCDGSAIATLPPL